MSGMFDVSKAGACRKLIDRQIIGQLGGYSPG
jgi:hypothetical protein